MLTPAHIAIINEALAVGCQVTHQAKEWTGQVQEITVEGQEATLWISNGAVRNSKYIDPTDIIVGLTLDKLVEVVGPPLPTSKF